MATKSIGIFDSGMGGLSVMRAIKALLPQENLVYFGDTARVPYGNKSADTIIRYTLESAAFLAEQDIKLLVIACHTACAYSLSELEKTLQIPVVGVITKGLSELTHYTQTNEVAVLCTQSTASSQIYQKHFAITAPHIHLQMIPCPLFVPLVEEGFEEHPMAQLAAQEYLLCLKKRRVDALFLGCTHYPHLINTIQKQVGPQVKLFDPSLYCAEAVYETLEKEGLLRNGGEDSISRFFVSDDPERFERLGKRFLGEALNKAVLVNPMSLGGSII